jgi:Ca2+-binding EF-hand superfamily protein
MKFFHLLAAASAVQIQQQESKGPDDDKMHEIFDHVDTSNDGFIDEPELVTALKAYAKEKNHKITPADAKWVEGAADKADKNDDDKLDFHEFKHFVHMFMKHYGIKDDDDKDSGSDSDDDDDHIKQIFDHVDTNNNGFISKKELVKALKDFARSKNYKPTRKDWRWVRRTARKSDKNHDRKLDLQEFEHFVRAFVKHYKLDEDHDDKKGGDDKKGDHGDLDAKLHQIFNHVDTSGDGFVDQGELMTALKDFAKSKGHKITQADIHFVMQAADDADKNDDDKFNFDEFKHFVKDFADHYKIKL